MSTEVEISVEDMLARFHRDACYPDPMAVELSLAAAAIVKLVLTQERIEIARMIEAKAREHDDAAREMEHDDDPDGEAWMHRCEASTLHGLADMVRARTPAVAEPVETEIAF